MSSTQQQKSMDLIEFNSNSNSNDTMDILDKPNTGVVQKMVMSETASASLIATAVAKLTTSSVTAITTPTKPSNDSVLNKSESDSMAESPSNQKLDNVNVDTEHPSTLMTSPETTAIITTTTTTSAESVTATAPPHSEPISTQVCAIRSLSHCLHFIHHKIK